MIPLSMIDKWVYTYYRLNITGNSGTYTGLKLWGLLAQDTSRATMFVKDNLGNTTQILPNGALFIVGVTGATGMAGVTGLPGITGATGASNYMNSGASYPELTAELYGSLNNGMGYNNSGYYYYPPAKIMLDQSSTNIYHMMRQGVGTGCNLTIDCNR